MKRVTRWAGWLIGGIVLALVLGTVVPRPLLHDAEAAAPAHAILIIANPIHTDIAISADADTRRRFGFLARAGLPVGHPDARWLIFGWGSRAFYTETPTWADLKPVPVLKAFTLDRSVIHAEVAGDIDQSHPAVTRHEIGEVEFERLLGLLEASFQTGPDGPIHLPGTAYGPYDGFFEANGSFNALAGCNTWTARALREAGLRTGWWTPLPASLGLSLRLHN